MGYFYYFKMSKRERPRSAIRLIKTSNILALQASIVHMVTVGCLSHQRKLGNKSVGRDMVLKATTQKNQFLY